MGAILIYGAGGHGKVVADIVEKEGTCRIAGLIDDALTETTLGYEILGEGEDVERIMKEGIRAAIVAVGDNRTRGKIQARLLAAGLEIVSAIHPMASVARGATIGLGTVVAAGAVVGPDAVVGEGCIVNHCASVDHDCSIGALAHVAPGANIGGGVLVEEGALIGTGASVKPGLHIGAGSVVGMGATVIRDVEPDIMVVGVPAEPAGSSSS